MSPIASPLRSLSGIPDASRIEKKKTVLIMTGFQMEYFTGALAIPELDLLVDKASKLMDWADKNKIKTIHTVEYAKSPASPVYAQNSEGIKIHPDLQPRKNHDFFPKYGTSIFSGTLLHGNLQAANIDAVILAGMTTPLSITVSAHDAWALGYKCFVLADLTASRDLLSWDKTKIIPSRQMQEASLAGISDRFAQVLACAELTALPLD